MPSSRSHQEQRGQYVKPWGRREWEYAGCNPPRNPPRQRKETWQEESARIHANQNQSYTDNYNQPSATHTQVQPQPSTTSSNPYASPNAYQHQTYAPSYSQPATYQNQSQATAFQGQQQQGYYEPQYTSGRGQRHDNATVRGAIQSQYGAQNNRYPEAHGDSRGWSGYYHGSADRPSTPSVVASTVGRYREDPPRRPKIRHDSHGNEVYDPRYENYEGYWNRRG